MPRKRPADAGPPMTPEQRGRLGNVKALAARQGWPEIVEPLEQPV